MSYYEFTPMTDEEIDSFGLIEDGVYDFMTTKSERKVSAKGNPMAAITLTVWDKEGNPKTIFDYLVFSSAPLSIKKLKHYCEAVGLEKEYKDGKIPEALDNMGGKVKIGTQDETPKGDGTFYPKKNVVLDYIKSNEKKIAPSQVDEFADSDIPF